MHFADSIVIFVLALILFGPKKLPEIARQIGKLMVEFRRASNEFKAQIDEELRTMEMQERQKKLEAAAAAPAATPPPPESSVQTSAPAEESSEPKILPPSSGETVSSGRPYMPVAPREMVEEAAVEPHPVYAEALAAENGNSPDPRAETENAQATVDHG